MTSTKESKEAKEIKPAKRTRPFSPSYSAQEKAQAVLAVWTERCRSAEICRELKISYMTFLQWQQRAMEGMLQALESRVNLARGEVLSPRLQALLQKQQRTAGLDKISARLDQIPLAKTTAPPAQTP